MISITLVEDDNNTEIATLTFDGSKVSIRKFITMLPTGVSAEINSL